MNNPNSVPIQEREQSEMPLAAKVIYHVVAKSADTLQTDLEAAISHATRVADRNRHGVLITRHTATLFTVTPTAGVPHRQTREHDQWLRNPVRTVSPNQP